MADNTTSCQGENARTGEVAAELLTKQLEPVNGAVGDLHQGTEGVNRAQAALHEIGYSLPLGLHALHELLFVLHTIVLMHAVTQHEGQQRYDQAGEKGCQAIDSRGRG